MPREEIARVEKVQVSEDREFSWRRTTVILTSDGEVLRRDLVRLRASGRFASTGWVHRSQLRRWRDPESFVPEFLRQWKRRGFEPL